MRTAMKFVLNEVTRDGARLGRLVLERREAAAATNLELETPLCLIHTRSGFVPCLTPDIVQELPHLPPASLLSVATMYEHPGTEVLTVYNKGVHKFLGLEEHLLYLSVQDPHCPPPTGYNEQKNVSVWCPSGRRKLTVSEHLKFVKVLQPDVFEALCDSASSQGNKLKRIRKSVDRTLKFLDETLESRANIKELQDCAVLGAIVGGDDEEERKRSSKETADRAVDGFVLEGFDLPHSKETLASIIDCVTSFLPQNKPRFVHGLHTPSDIFTAVEHGVDVFDSSHCLTAAEHGSAFLYPITLSSTPQDTSASLHFSDGSRTLQTPQLELDLSQAQYVSDFTPILAGCPCYACKHHCRAYIHHLLLSKELLGSILLMIHNLSRTFSFFHNLRTALRTGSYEQFRNSCLQRTY